MYPQLCPHLVTPDRLLDSRFKQPMSTTPRGRRVLAPPELHAVAIDVPVAATANMKQPRKREAAPHPHHRKLFSVQFLPIASAILSGGARPGLMERRKECSEEPMEATCANIPTSPPVGYRSRRTTDKFLKSWRSHKFDSKAARGTVCTNLRRRLLFTCTEHSIPTTASERLAARKSPGYPNEWAFPAAWCVLQTPRTDSAPLPSPAPLTT